MSTQSVPFTALLEYLAVERKAEIRSEYLNGQIFPLSAGTFNHARIVTGALTQLTDQLRDTPCEAVGGDLRLYCAPCNVLTYPDVVVTCRPFKFLDERRDTITDATLIVEVLSPSTMNDDRGEKFRYYRSLPSFSEYLLLAQDAVRAEHHARQSDGSWVFREISLPGSDIRLSSIGCGLQLKSLYARVDFELEPRRE